MQRSILGIKLASKNQCKFKIEKSKRYKTPKRQLRTLIIEIQKAIAKIKMIKFRNRSLWNCQVYKNPLKEIVINIEVDATEIEKLITKDKKRSRDRHEFASSWY